MRPQSAHATQSKAAPRLCTNSTQRATRFGTPRWGFSASSSSPTSDAHISLKPALPSDALLVVSCVADADGNCGEEDDGSEEEKEEEEEEEDVSDDDNGGGSDEEEGTIDALNAIFDEVLGKEFDAAGESTSVSPGLPTPESEALPM
jgi:hypothetical protein